MNKYKVLESNYASTFLTALQEHLDHGWIPMNNPVCHNNTWVCIVYRGIHS
jgi:hypothetical protein